MQEAEASKKIRYVVGSGWWCDSDTTQQGSARKLQGDNFIRTQAFHRLWYQSVVQNCDPVKILIVDSNSPVRPEIDGGDDRIEFLSLPLNAGHAADCDYTLSGWTRSVLLGLQYAALSEVDYFVYIEQDVLLKGRGIIEHCIEQMSTPYMFGHGAETPQPLQQSLMIFKTSHAMKFIERYMAISCSDRELSPEQKFVIATSRFPCLLLSYVCRIKDRRRRKLLRRFCNFDPLPVGYGRSRPINFSDRFYYFQHGSREEIECYLEQTPVESLA